MKTKTTRSSACFLTLIAVLCLTNNVRSQENFAEVGPEWFAAFNNRPVAETLVTTYQILGKGNRNYVGHRVKAMAEIKTVATLLNIELPPREKGGQEEQKISDGRISVSWRLLDQLYTRLADENQPDALEHVAQAMNQLSRALRVRTAIQTAEDEADQAEAAVQQ